VSRFPRLPGWSLVAACCHTSSSLTVIKIQTSGAGEAPVFARSLYHFRGNQAALFSLILSYSSVFTYLVSVIPAMYLPRLCQISWSPFSAYLQQCLRWILLRVHLTTCLLTRCLSGTHHPASPTLPHPPVKIHRLTVRLSSFLFFFGSFSVLDLQANWSLLIQLRLPHSLLCYPVLPIPLVPDSTFTTGSQEIKSFSF